MREMLRFLIFVLVAGASGLAAAEHPNQTTKVAASVPTIVLRGDHCTLRALNELVKSFEARRQGKVTLQPFSTVSGLDAVAAGSADLAASARPAMPERVEEQGTNFYPVAWDALVPIVAATNPVGEISLQQLHDVYLGRITNWKELGGPDAPINLDGVAAPLDGVEYSTRLLLFHFGDQPVSVSRLYLNVEKLEEDIALNEHGLGMSTLSGVAHNPKVKMLAVEGVRASPATIADGSYPLYTTLYLAARDDDRQHETVAKLIAFAGSEDGKALLRKHELVPYADAADLIARQDTRAAFIDARLHPQAANTTGSSETPIAAPRATAQALERVAPTSERTLEAKERAERAAAETDRH